MSHISVHRVEVPEYAVNAGKPDFDSISAPIVGWLRAHFMRKRIGLRFLGSMEHPGKSIDDLIKHIKELGHDRYDSERKGDRYENVEGKKIEIFALAIEVGKELGDNGEEEVKHALNSFYAWPPKYGRPPIRVDIGIVYDLDQLEPVPHRYKGRENELKTDGYLFKNPDRKADAVLAIFKII